MEHCTDNVGKMCKMKENTIRNFIWRFAERVSAQGVSLLVSIVLARVLMPEDYGSVALVTVFTTILQVFIDSGLGTALIQKKNADDLDFSSVFYFNVAVCIVLYMVMFIAAPHIAQFYDRRELIPLIRVISLSLVISGVKNIQQAYVSRNMLFKRFFFATIGGTIFSAVIGIAMAYNGFGVWALVAQQLSNPAIDTLILWITVKWRPKLMFSWHRLKGLLSFGGKMLASALLATVYNNLWSLIIGKRYSPMDLAFYNQGEQFPMLIINNINTSIDSVLLPTMSRAQDNVEQVREMTRRAISISTYVMAPMMIGLAVVAPTLVELVLTEKWLPCVPFLRISCVTYIFFPIHTANLNAIKALGRSDLFLKLEIEKKVMGLTVLLCTMWYGVMAMAYSLLLTDVLSQIINSWPNRKLLNYSYPDQLKDILPGILLAVVMGACVLPLKLLPYHDFVILMLQVLLGTVVYIATSILFKIEAFDYLLKALSPVIWGILHF